jgi:hypothetical protein
MGEDAQEEGVTMPQFINSPFQKPQLLQKGVPAYLIGSFSQKVGNTHLALLTDAIATNVATITATYLNGPLPVIGSLISIINSTNSSGAFNVSRAVITAVSYNATTNVMTINFALTGTNQTATADGGTVDIEPAEVGETIAQGGLVTMVIDAAGTLWAVGDQFTIAGGTGGVGQVTAETGGVPSAVAIVTAGSGYTATTGAVTTAKSPSTGIGLTVTTTVSSGNYTSQAVLVQAPEGDSQFTLPLSVFAGPGITAMTATLQRAIKTQTNEWTNTTTVVTKTGATTYTAGPVVEATLERAYLYRIVTSSVTGSDVVIAKVG